MARCRVVYVTSFPERLWACSGRPLVDSFRASGTPGVLVAAAEGLDVPAGGGVEAFRLDADPLLARLLARHAEVIPEELGGAWAGPCGCPHPADPHAKDHKPACPGYWFNKHASRWLRKPLAAWRAAERAAELGAEAVVWVDADSVFRRTLPADEVMGWFGGSDCWYLQGKRPSPETGLVGFRAGRGYGLISAWLDRYRLGAFRADTRWDDTHQLRMALKAWPGVAARDIAGKLTGHSEVVPSSPCGPYFTHHKGQHSRVLGIYR